MTCEHARCECHADYEKKVGEVESLEMQLNSKRSESKQLWKRVETLTKGLSEKDEQIQALQDSSSCADLEKTMLEKESQITDLMKRNQELFKSLEETQEELKELKTEHKTLKTQAAAAPTFEFEVLLQQLKDQKEENARLQQAAEASAGLEDLQLKVQVKNSECKQLWKRVEALTATIAERDQTIQDLQSNSLQNEVDAKQKEVNEVRQQLQRVSSELASTKAERDQLKKERKQQVQTRAPNENDRSTLDMQALMQQLKDAKETNAELQARLAECSAEDFSAVVQERDIKKSECKQLWKRVEGLTQKHAEAAQRVEELEEQLKTMETAQVLEQVKADCAAHSRRSAELSQQLHTASEELRTLKELNAQKKPLDAEDKESLLQQLQDRKEEVASLNSQIEALLAVKDKDSDTLLRELHSSHVENTHLQHQLHLLTATLAEQSKLAPSQAGHMPTAGFNMPAQRAASAAPALPVAAKESHIDVTRFEHNGAAILYEVSWAIAGSPTQTTMKRYSELLVFHEQYVSVSNMPSKPVFPPKRLFFATDVAFLQERRRALSLYLSAVFKHAQLRGVLDAELQGGKRVAADDLRSQASTRMCAC